MKKNLTIALTVLLGIALIIWLILSAIYGNPFWGICFTEWIKLVVTIVLGYFVAYILVERNSKKRKFKELIVSQLQQLKEKLHKDQDMILTAFPKTDWKTLILTSSRETSNSIDLLTKFSKRLNAEKLIPFIREQFVEYRTITTDCIDTLRSDPSLREKASMKLGLIMNKLDEIILLQFDEKSGA